VITDAEVETACANETSSLVPRIALTASLVTAALVLLLSSSAGAQSAAPATYKPLTDTERGEWILQGTFGARSLSIGVFTSSFLTAVDAPPEWHRSWGGFGKRYVNREATNTISNGIEAGLGSIWGEDPRYGRRGGDRVWPRVAHALKSGVMARGRNGRLRPAWARYAGTATSAAVASTWLPPSTTTPKGTTWRISSAVLGRMVGNAFEEFWPDVRRALRKSP
jgi:hypothetical protein